MAMASTQMTFIDLQCHILQVFSNVILVYSCAAVDEIQLAWSVARSLCDE